VPDNEDQLTPDILKWLEEFPHPITLNQVRLLIEGFTPFTAEKNGLVTAFLLQHQKIQELEQARGNLRHRLSNILTIERDKLADMAMIENLEEEITTLQTKHDSLLLKAREVVANSLPIIGGGDYCVSPEKMVDLIEVTQFEEEGGGGNAKGS